MASETLTSGLRWPGCEADHLTSIQCQRLRKGQGLQGTVIPMSVSVTGIETGIWGNVNK